MEEGNGPRDAAKSKRALDNDGLHRRRGVWHYKIKVNGNWKERSTGTASYQEARRVRAEALEAQQKGQLPTDKGKLPFEKAMETWLAARAAAMAARMISANTLRIERERSGALLKAFTGRRLNTFTIDDVKTYQAARAKAASPKTVNLETALLRMILKDARAWAPVADEYKPLRRTKSRPGVALNPEEERRLFETAARKPGWEVAYFATLVAANTTMRSCEVKGLRVADTDLFNRTVTIRGASTRPTRASA